MKLFIICTNISFFLLLKLKIKSSAFTKTTSLSKRFLSFSIWQKKIINGIFIHKKEFRKKHSHCYIIIFQLVFTKAIKGMGFIGA